MPDSDTGEDVERETEIDRTTTQTGGARTLRRLADGVADGTVVHEDLEIPIPDRFEIELEYVESVDEAELEVELEWPIADGDPVAVDGDAAETADEAIDVAPADASTARFELYQDRADEWRWRLVHNNGNIIADSGEGYARKAAARNGLESVMRNAPGADVVERED